MIDTVQTMHLAQNLHLSPTLLQSMKILQMNTQELSDYLNATAEENPVLSREEATDRQTSWLELRDKIQWLRTKTEPHHASYIEEQLKNAYIPSHAESLSISLNDQLSRLNLSPNIFELTKFLVKMLDEHGYLYEDEIEELENYGIPKSMLSQAINILQSLDPIGIAARNLSEYLQIQLKHLPGDHTLALSISKFYLTYLAKQKYEWIAKNLEVTVAEILQAEALIKSLNPYPIFQFEESKPTAYLYPDAWIAEVDGKISVFLNDFDLPQFRLSEDYLEMLKQTQDKELEQYLRQKVQQAQWLLDCVERRNKTLQKCLLAITAWQSDYFFSNGSLCPMTQYDIAIQISVHPSTVSRTIRNKYLECQQGLFPISHFFSRKVGQGSEAPSEMVVKQFISQVIHEEDRKNPISDQMLTSLLQKKNIIISRRTVSKYRNELGFHNSYQRKISSRTAAKQRLD